jgi:hypothetical protein
MKFKAFSVVSKADSFPVGDAEGHNIILMMREGMVLFEDGEVSAYKAFSTTKGMIGKGGSFHGYVVLNFRDGSTIVATMQQSTFYPDPEGKYSVEQKGVCEIVSGSGRFTGIKGSGSFIAKNLPVAKGELGGRGYADFIITYTVPPK